MAETVLKRRPFWRFFILNTEQWLEGMSSSGFHLCNFNFHGSFEFRAGNPEDYKYCFTFTKFEGADKCHRKSKWEKIAQQDKWCVYRIAKEEKAVMPNRRGLYLHNNSLLCLYALVSSIVLLAALGVAFGLFTLFSQQSLSNEGFFSGSIGIISVFALLLIVNFIFFLSLTSSNNRILEEPGAAVKESVYKSIISRKTFERWLEKLLIKDGDIIKRFRPLWLMSPRELENWLSKMERRGFNVYKVHKTGFLFYFIKSAPRSMAYCVVNNDGDTVPRGLKEGWQVNFSTTGRFGRLGRIAVISRAFEGNPPLPFKSEKEYITNAARIMLNFVLIYIILLLLCIVWLLTLSFYSAAQLLIMIAGIVALACTILIIRMLFYFTYSVIISRRLHLKRIP